jgi:hypothetical protein
MRSVAPGVVVLLLCLPALASAQASIAGVVTDASGAVLPGVTVEVSSPALLEKTRAAVTNGAGINANPALTQNFNFDAWLRPTNILQARFLKLGVQLNF